MLRLGGRLLGIRGPSKKDLPKVKAIRKNAYQHECQNGLHCVSFKKPYPRQK